MQEYMKFNPKSLNDVLALFNDDDIEMIIKPTKIGTIVCRTRNDNNEFISQLYKGIDGKYFLYFIYSDFRKVVPEDDDLYRTYFESEIGKLMSSLRDSYKEGEEHKILACTLDK